MAEKPGFAGWWEAIGRVYQYEVTARELCAAAFAAGNGLAFKKKQVKTKSKS
jgi:H+/Cl- antiporter ClcA